MKLYDYVKYEPTDSDWLVYRYDHSDIFRHSVLLVKPGQEALVVQNGKVMKIFGNGEYALDDTHNIPFITKLASKKFRGLKKGETQFPCDIYFFNKGIKLDFKWALGSPLPFRIQYEGERINIQVNARGNYSLKLEDYQNFLENYLTTLPWDDRVVKFDALRSWIQGNITSIVSDELAKMLRNGDVDILDLAASISELEAFTRQRIVDAVKETGFSLKAFRVEGIVPIDPKGHLEDIYDAVKKAGTARKIHRQTGKGKAEGLEGFRGMGANEYTQYNVMGREETLKEGAKNGKSGAHTIMGIGMGMNLGKQFLNGDQIGGSAAAAGAAADQQQLIKCPTCGEMIKPTTKFCPECGSPIITKCPKCQTRVPAGMKFCPECGEKLYKK